ncbi:MAG: hypothetical protein ABSB80_03620 [Methanoregula sp.]|jgi:hypothetical protein|uniref:hypothetical protein n=1 Tax=Methanoregula sp. TaxID=2052170 RepID=UPI003D11D4BA
MDILESSINRAIHLLKTPVNYEDYISIKIKPIQGGCCCFNCWPKTWARINDYIYPLEIRDEGDVLLETNNEKFVLECHENGPEIITYLELGISAIGLIITLLKFLQDDNKAPAKIKILKRRLIKGQIEEEELMEIDFPLSDMVVERINKNLEKALKRKKKI